MVESRIIPGIQELIKAEEGVRTQVAAEPKPVAQPVKNRVAPPNEGELIAWRRTNGAGIKYLGQPRR